MNLKMYGLQRTEMPGIKIRATPVETFAPHSQKLQSVEPITPYNDISEFPFYFLPILIELGNYHWYCADLRFNALMPEATQHILAASESAGIPHFYPKGTLLPLFAPYILEDWASFYGFSTQKTTWTMEGYVMETAIYFHNCDGLWWEMYALEEHLLHQVKTYLSYFQNIEVTDQRLQNPEALYPVIEMTQKIENSPNDE